MCINQKQLTVKYFLNYTTNQQIKSETKSIEAVKFHNELQILTLQRCSECFLIVKVCFCVVYGCNIFCTKALNWLKRVDFEAITTYENREKRCEMLKFN